MYVLSCWIKKLQKKSKTSCTEGGKTTTKKTFHNQKTTNALLLVNKASLDYLLTFSKPLFTTYKPFIKHVLLDSGTNWLHEQMKTVICGSKKVVSGPWVKIRTFVFMSEICEEFRSQRTKHFLHTFLTFFYRPSSTGVLMVKNKLVGPWSRRICWYFSLRVHFKINVNQ